MQLAPTATPTSSWPLDPRPLRPGKAPSENAVAQARTTFFWNYGLQRDIDVERGRTLGAGFASVDDAIVAISHLNRRSAGVVTAQHGFDVVELLVPDIVHGAGPWTHDEFWRGVRPTQLIRGDDDSLHRSIEFVRPLPFSSLAAVVTDGLIQRF